MKHIIFPITYLALTTQSRSPLSEIVSCWHYQPFLVIEHQICGKKLFDLSLARKDWDASVCSSQEQHQQQLNSQKAAVGCRERGSMAIAAAWLMCQNACSSSIGSSSKCSFAAFLAGLPRHYFAKCIGMFITRV